ncbi:MAG: LL-diaminopimelate aminotransferase, partial [Planctomycetota bacterium]
MLAQDAGFRRTFTRTTSETPSPNPNDPTTMALVNENYLKLAAGYLFPEIARRVSAFAAERPELAKDIIRCGIGDVTEPLPPSALRAMHAANEELANRSTFKGYGPGTGYESVRAAIAHGDFRSRGLEVADDEIFLSDGSKGDCGNILEILGAGNRIAVTDPVYPAYVDANVMCGNTGAALAGGGYEGITYLPCTEANGFLADIPAAGAPTPDVIYLCSPNNPTGTVMDRARLEKWVAYAREHRALLFWDAAYEAYNRDPQAPKSVYEIAGARECAIEFRSFSKSGGFTGVRCGYTVLPKSVMAYTRAGAAVALHGLWTRRWNTRSNGVSYAVQRGAEALYTESGKREVAALVDFYMENARILREGCRALGWKTWGGEHAPYVWCKTPGGIDSWTFFDTLLRQARVVTTPGAGFGRCGEGYFRISAFNS